MNGSNPQQLLMSQASHISSNANINHQMLGQSPEIEDILGSLLGQQEGGPQQPNQTDIKQFELTLDSNQRSNAQD
jgi:hypothetical protein